MKVFPISAFRPKNDQGFHARISANDVQMNVDHNVGFKSFVPGQPIASGKVAVVGYGPSLKRTWENIAAGDFDAVWTVSGAHDFLVECGVVPDYHTDIDWRSREPQLLNQPQRETQYVMANTIPPRYAQKLKTYDLRMFQPVGEKVAPFFRLGQYPKVRIPGDVATAALVLAYESGFRDITTFGLDGSYDLDATHAGVHNYAPSDILYVTDKDFELYKTSGTLVVSNMIFCETADALPDASVQVVSDGLLPHWLAMYNARKAANG